ncbi:WALL-ASSOCIATED RECEPTOR KINASE-LIKE 14 [Salix koriyanagi]|uniref:WALL-ASSOCIATED RECEPTOR KINASE-LIKE 14 n=1 Tax=Salix koriyanagi TaxID=2511006 RepID=A0A9Q0UMN6_9ROSI|nr:WALL-ASSOCIATED RECEPTOR KINASE-LIKE 14 [Salix koriyanagi]
MSLKQESLVLFIAIITVFIAATSTTARAQKFNSSNCKSSCGTGKHANVVPYPFGFSNGCPIILKCNHTVGDVKIGEFQVQNITPNGILINIPAECDRSIETIRPLFGRNFSPSSNNSFLLQNCNSSNKSSSSCVISTSSLRKDLNLTNCGAKNHDLNCYSPVPGDSDTFDINSMISTQCKSVFSSLVFGWESSVVSFQIERVKLEWWLSGDCAESADNQCSNNATCTQVKLWDRSSGFRCHCNDGFAGDGFVDGNGCRRVSKCNVSKYMSGRCGGTTRIAVLVGGLVAGALLMACLALLWYYVRRKSTSLRNQSSAKRLLFEAAGNSSVPFFHYKEIEKATNGFSEKQRLGTGAYGTVYAGKLHSDDLVAIKKLRHRDTNSIDQVMNEINEVNLAALAVDRIGRGCVDEIIDSYLDPNRDAWTLTSIHTVAELAFRCLAFHRDMRPTMTEVAEELEQIMLSAWIPTMYMASPSTSSCSSEYGSQKSLSVSIGSLAGIASGKLLPPQRTDSLTSLEETKDISPDSVQDTWLSEQSSPSKNSLLDNVVR